MFKTKVIAYPTTEFHKGLVIGLFEQSDIHESVKELNENVMKQLTSLIKARKFVAAFGECTPIYPLGALSFEIIYIIGLGKKEELTSSRMREAIAKVGTNVSKHKIKDLAILVESFTAEQINKEKAATLIGEGLALSLYRAIDYKEKTNETDHRLENVTLYGAEERLKDDVQTGYTFGMGTNHARTLVNIPGNLLTPSDLATSAKELAVQHGFEYEILEREEMEKLGMGALLAVAAGSDQRPKMIVMRYEGNEKSKEVIGLVGKGLTFDSGGISIKGRENMHQMKMDMAGAAAVLGAMDIIGTLKPSVNVLVVIPATENLLNGSALKPGDVIRALNGKTIEVRNTDAEGRLILADGVTYAKQLGATSIIDVATLTGAVLVALGDCTTGAVTNNKGLMEELLLASNQTDEWVWPLPNYEPYKKMVKSSDVADLNNAPGRLAGSITAGLFIGEFAEETPWVHLDIAGTAWQSKKTALGPLGGTGVMARTLAQFVINKGEKIN
ncbi:leucyl aminopeptidase [bacterium LRH843]|nr:leucyl aminopeptidase [bacterium LRH843]